MTIYHTETEEDYNSLMVELEKQGFRWGSGGKPTEEFNYKEYTSETTITTDDDVINYSCVEFEIKFNPEEPIIEYNPEEPIIEYKSKKKVETNDFIKELTVKIYYNEITKKHYNSYDDAIADCKRKIERLYDKN